MPDWKTGGGEQGAPATTRGGWQPVLLPYRFCPSRPGVEVEVLGRAGVERVPRAEAGIELVGRHQRIPCPPVLEPRAARRGHQRVGRRPDDRRERVLPPLLVDVRGPRVSRRSEHRDVIGDGLLEHRVELLDQRIGAPVERLFGRPEALADHRPGVGAHRHLLALQHAGQALLTLRLSRVRGDQHDVRVGRDGVRPLQIEAGLEGPVDLDPVHGVVVARLTARVDDVQVRRRQAERRAEELEIGQRGGTAVGVHDHDGLPSPGNPSVVERVDTVGGVHVRGRIAMEERVMEYRCRSGAGGRLAPLGGDVRSELDQRKHLEPPNRPERSRMRERRRGRSGAPSVSARKCDSSSLLERCTAGRHPPSRGLDSGDGRNLLSSGWIATCLRLSRAKGIAQME